MYAVRYVVSVLFLCVLCIGVCCRLLYVCVCVCVFLWVGGGRSLKVGVGFIEREESEINRKKLAGEERHF